MEKVFLVGIHQKRSSAKLNDSYESLQELAKLVETAGGEVVGQVLQSVSAFSPATLIGKGKVEEFARRGHNKEFDTLIFDEELKPAQQKNLSEQIPAKILDRTRLILDIFAKRARTREGILQVELAQLSYLLPRMTERYGRFEQQVGGIGTRGPGERKLEVEARHIRDKMAFLKRQIESVKLHREVARERRRNVPLPVITIVGYTNAGKSTLLNKLVELYGESTETVYADNKLFATLDPTTRRVRLPSGRWSLFTDTVGFIEKLPHHLIAAFRSTLEETVESDLLLHIIDVSDSNRTEHAKTVHKILSELQADQSYADKMITIYNKTDKLSSAEKSAILVDQERLLPGQLTAKPIYVSSIDGTGLRKLLQLIEARLSHHMIETDLYVPFAKSRLLDSIYRLGKVEKTVHRKKGVQLHLRLEKFHLDRIHKLLNDDLPK